MCLLLVLTPRHAYGKAVSKGFIADEEENEVAAMDKIVEINTKQSLYKLFEGDVKLREDDLDERHEVKRNALRDRNKLWLTRIIPYEISDDLISYKQPILDAFEEFHNKSCLVFVPRTTEGQWIKFAKYVGCWSFIGRGNSTGPQILSLGSGCYSKGVIIHEILHALGFQHEQSRPDRDYYVEIFWENIIESETHNFKKFSHDYLDILGVQYDLESVMHYGRKAFSKDSKDTIRAISGANIGQRDGFSKTDIIKLNSLYNCHLLDVGWSDWSSFSPCSKDCSKKRQRYCFSSKPEDCPSVTSHGVQTEYSSCTTAECYAPINGHWGRWSSWSACSKNCSLGTKSRTRTCTDPAPLHGGQYCSGNAKEFEDCTVKTTCDPDNCQFTSGVCHWIRDTSVGYYWQRHQGGTMSGGTGPDADHTTGSGYYIYAEASAPAEPNDVALLSSKVFPPSQCRCIAWYYNMYGASMGELSVYVKDSEGHRRELWSKKGDQGNQWISGEATISNISSMNYQVEFEAIRGSSYKADVALDDISFYEMPCGVQRLGCFKDHFNRMLPDLIANLRGEIDWSDMQKTVRKCACMAQEKGYKHFAVQFYGECWGSKDYSDYDRYGASDNCWSGVGKDFTNFVYKFTD